MPIARTARKAAPEKTVDLDFLTTEAVTFIQAHELLEAYFVAFYGGKRRCPPGCHLHSRILSLKTVFNWSQVYKGIRDNLDVLPDLYEYKEARLRSHFRKDLCTFARQLMLADPQDLLSAGSLIQVHSAELEYLAELIRWRLNRCKQEPTEWNADHPFFWRFALQGTGVPPDIEEHVPVSMHAVTMTGQRFSSASLPIASMAMQRVTTISDLFPSIGKGWRRQSHILKINVKTSQVSETALLKEVQKFHEDSLKGVYYAPFDINSKNYMDIPEETQESFEKLADLLGDAAMVGEKGNHQLAVQCFNILRVFMLSLLIIPRSATREKRAT